MPEFKAAYSIFFLTTVMKIASLERRVFGVAWFGAILWNGIIVFGTFSDFRNHTLASHFGYHRPQDLIPLFFPAIGVALLIWAIRQTVLLSTYGQTFFISDADRFPLGGKLQGKIVFSRPNLASINRHFRLRLSYQMGTGKDTRSVWSDSHFVDLAPDGTIPILFSLPEKISPPLFILGGAPVTWYLKANETGGGFKSFAAEYVLPTEEGSYSPFKNKLRH